MPVEYFSRSACSGQSVDCVEAVAKKTSNVKNDDWTFWKSVSWDEELRVISYDEESNSLITVENGEQDLSAIFKTNLKTGDRRLVYKHDTVDIGSVLVDEEGAVFGTTLMDGYLSRVFFKGENKEKDRIKELISKFPGSMLSILSLSDNEKKITFTVSSDINPGIHYLLDLELSLIHI